MKFNKNKSVMDDSFDLLRLVENDNVASQSELVAKIKVKRAAYYDFGSLALDIAKMPQKDSKFN